MKILGIGESVIDNVYMQGELSKSQHIGGPVLSALILLSRLHLDCTFLTSIGSDHEGEIIKQTLAEENVRIRENREEKTKINTIRINAHNGQREKIRGAIEHAPIKDIPAEFIQEFDLIIMDRHEKKAFYEVISKKKLSTKVVIDPSTEISAFTLDMIKYAEYPIVPIEALAKIGEGKELAICLQLLYGICNRPITITAGELGSLIYDGNTVELIPGVEVKAVDTTGAGDLYRGAFAYGIIQEWDLRTCASFANSVAALQCTKVGNVAAIPNEEEIKLFTGLLNQKRLLSVAKINNYFLDLHQSL